jgi:hypothetical protein
MKPRHAAALALVGWYLMIPPQDHEHPLYPNTSAPMSEWTQMYAVGKASECEDTIVKLHDKLAKQGDKVHADFSLSAACVESNDPRLAR